jgi:hypothetical protein
MPRSRLWRFTAALAGAGVLLAGFATAVLAPRPARDRTVTRGHEPGDVSPRGVLAVAGVFVVGLALALVFVSWLEARFTGRPLTLRPPTAGVANAPGAPSALPRQEPVIPLHGQPWRDLATLRHAQSARLSSYGWVDREAGVVRVPIDRAMEALARRGLPARPPGPPAPVAAPSASGRFVERTR